MNKALYRLMAGFRHFHDKYYLQDEKEMYARLVSVGQTPKTLMIGCSDSRVDPAILTEASPGELFIVRNVGALIPPCEPAAHGYHGTSTALEFAVVNLKVENIVILGHRQCGGIRALMSNNHADEGTFIGQWMSIAAEARKEVLRKYPDADEESQRRFAEMEAIKVSLRNLMTFPFVKEAVDAKRLNLIGVYFDIEQGQLWELEDVSQEFRQLGI
jgi:carbonic anhydrase